jgi:hypothetical protein
LSRNSISAISRRAVYPTGDEPGGNFIDINVWSASEPAPPGRVRGKGDTERFGKYFYLVKNHLTEAD